GAVANSGAPEGASDPAAGTGASGTASDRGCAPSVLFRAARSARREPGAGSSRRERSGSCEAAVGRLSNRPFSRSRCGEPSASVILDGLLIEMDQRTGRDTGALLGVDGVLQEHDRRYLIDNATRLLL